MGKGGSKSQTVTQKQEIPPFLQNQLQQVFGAAQNIQPAVFAGERVAGFSPLETLGQQLTAERALAGDQTVDQARGLLEDTLAGDYLENPFLQNQIDNAISSAVNQATSQYALGGRLGSGAFGTALGAGITGAAAPILANQYNAERGRQMQAAQMAPQLAAQDFIDLAALSGVGQQQRQLSQAQIQAQRDFINELNAAQLSKFGSLASAAGLTPSAMNTSSTQPGVSPLAGAAGGALTGAALGSLFPTAAASASGATGFGASFGPMGALVGGGLGLLGLV